MTDKNFAEVYGRSLPISSKVSMIICDEIKNKELSKAKIILEGIVSMRKPLRFRKFNSDLCHKPGMAAGRYPIKAGETFLKLLDSLESNAGNKGLNTNSLIISYAKADKAETRWHYGRQGRVKFKSTHVRIRAEEKKKE